MLTFLVPPPFLFFPPTLITSLVWVNTQPPFFPKLIAGKNRLAMTTEA